MSRKVSIFCVFLVSKSVYNDDQASAPCSFTDTAMNTIKPSGMVLPKKMQDWAERTYNKAATFIRTISIAQQDDENDPEAISAQVQASDDYFFEQFAPKPPTAAENAIVDTSQLTIVKLSINENRETLHDLYVEALYTIVHKVGKSSQIPEINLIKYAQAAFQIDDFWHQKLMDKARKEKPPVVLLNVHLLEARDLIAKDINGFSDPFAMMGVVPGNRRRGALAAAGEEDTSDEEEPPASPNNVNKEQHPKPAGMLHRFSGSFRRKIGSKKGAKTENKAIPAKFIKASSVQKKTLNPKWNEKFQFIVEDVNTDKYHIDLWDHDDEEQSVIDAVTSLNEISGIKNLGRYFKEVTQSARAGSTDLVDDFLGLVTIRIKDIPSTGLEDWFTLGQRSEKSEVSGQVRLRLWLSTKEERISQQDDELLDVKQHIELIRQFALQEIRITGSPVSMFQGKLPDVALTILHQHAIQGDLTELHQIMCQWLAYSAMINIGISFAFLHDILKKLIDKWAPLQLEKSEDDMLAESFSVFVDHCKRVIESHQRTINTEKRIQLLSFENMIQCLHLLYESEVYSKCVPFRRSLKSEVEALLVQGARNEFKEYAKQLENDEFPAVELYSLLQALVTSCKKFSQFDPIFKENLGIESGALIYAEYDRLVHEYICSEMMSEKKGDLKTKLMSIPEDEATLVTILKVHFAINEFREFRQPKLKYKMDSLDWDLSFDRVIGKWIDIARNKAFARVDLACQLDAQIQISGSEIRQTSSYVDVCHIIEQMVTLWERTNVKNIGLRAELTEKLVNCICKVTEFYVDRVMAQVAADGFCGQLQPFLPPALINIFCAAINNAEQVRRSLAINDKLHLDILSDKYEKIVGKEAVFKKNVERDLDTCEKFVSEQIDSAVDRMVRRQMTQLKKHVFHLAWSPGACPVEQALKPLTDMLDAELSAVHRTLLHRNFVRVMHCQVGILLQLLHDCVNENEGLEPTFYQRLGDAWSILMDFFHADGKGITMETFGQIPAHVDLMRKLSINQMTTIKLIEQYYKDLLQEQNDVTECKYGILNVRAYYNANSQNLVIDVIGAKQIIPLDSNGLSDPFVVIELVPRVRYPNQPTAKTKVVSKTLNPIFDETFDFHIPPKIPPSAMVHFVVMDHDFLRSNDFAGEAFLDLKEVPGFGTAGVSNTLRQFNLVLIHPQHNYQEAMAVLESRKDDKDAQDFVKSLSITY
uniref:C2 domain-containing protein n=1 Tax=Panagrellus redivivus TaxID=6233 RepID=A0A7E4ZTK6_PANRE